MTPDNDPSPAPFGAFAPNAAQAAIISLAHRTRLKRGAFRPWLSRLVNLLRAGPVDVPYQGASFRFYHQASATERGALFNPDYNIEELDFLRTHIPDGRRVRRCRRQCRHLRAGAGASCRRRRQGDRDRAASGHPCAARVQQRRLRHYPGAAGRGRRRARRWRTADRNRRRQSRRQPHRVERRLRQGDQGAVAAAAAHPRRGRRLAMSMRSRSTSRVSRIAC